MSELLDHFEDVRRDSFASVANSFGDQSYSSESFDSSMTKEAPKKQSRSYKEVLTRPSAKLDVVSKSTASRKSNAKVSFADTKVPRKSRDWSFPPARGEAIRNKVAAMDKRDAEAAALKRQCGETTQRVSKTIVPGK